MFVGLSDNLIHILFRNLILEEKFFNEAVNNLARGKTELVNSLTHVGETDGRWARQARSLRQLIFLKSVRESTQVVFALSIQTQPQVDF